jgi:hypothetical protein
MTDPIDTNEIRYKISHAHPITMEDVDALCDEIDRLRGGQQTPPQGQGKTFIVALQLLEGTTNGEKSSIVLEAHNTDTVEEAIGAALLRHVGGVYSLGAYRAAALSSLTATLPVPAEVEVVAKVEGE